MEVYWNLQDWTLGLSLVGLTLAIHATGVVAMAFVDVRLRVRLETMNLGLRLVVPFVIGVVAVSGLLLAALHGVEAAFWAVAYLQLGVLGSPINAMFYSLDSMTTRGASGLELPQHLQMMGALEAADGILLFGISTAYMFAVMQAYWPMLMAQRR